MKYFVFGILYFAVTCFYAQETSASDIIDQRIELVSIVYRLSGAEEFTHIHYPDRVFTMYIDSIEEHFRKYEKHPAVQFARKLKKQGIGYHYAMYLPLIVSNPPDMEIVVPFKEGRSVYRWNANTAGEFLILLNQFYRDSDFEKFMEKNQPLFEAVEVRFSAMTSRINTEWFTSFFGNRSEFDFKMINAPGIGPNNYSVDVEFPQGKKSSFAILGSSLTDSLGMPVYDAPYLYVLVHEFNHSFVNPVVYENEGPLKKVGMKMYKHFKRQKIATNIAYGNWQSMLCETLVRAAVINYLKENEFDQYVIQRQIELEKARGFPWVEELTERFDDYSAHRDKYQDMADFIPELISFFEAFDQNPNNK